MKNCGFPDCIYPSFGKDKKTNIPYCSSHQYLRTDLDRRSAFEKHIDKVKKDTKKSADTSKIRGLSNLPANKDMAQKSEVRSALLLLADKLFGNHIKDRDAKETARKVSANEIILEDIGLTEQVVLGKEFIICPCCNKPYALDDVDGDNKKIVQPLHFVDRDVYSQRFNEEQVFAGCCYCNLKQHKTPDGIEYRNYRSFLVKRLGNEKVTEMEDEKYKVNRMSNAEIQEVIDKYNPKNKF